MLPFARTESIRLAAAAVKVHDELAALDLDAGPRQPNDASYPGIVALYAREETREEFWETLVRMLKTEPTSGVVLGLLQSLGQIAGR